MNGEWLQQARDYAARNWCILPMTVVGENKKPALSSYKQYQTERPTPETLTNWFSGVKVGRATLHGLGVMCGTVSGGLWCRDFDVAAAYERWKAAHPELARLLPTVKTARGFHVYGRSAVPVKTVDYDDGELRGEKAFVALPPSRHPSGTVYEWIVLLPDGELPLVDPLEAGLGMVTERQSYRVTEPTETQNGCVSLRLSVSLSLNDNERVEAAIANTLPTRKGLRNDNVFTFARALKAIPALADAQASDLRDIVKRWHSRALPIIKTKPFDATWADFCHAWPRVQYPLGQSPLETIMETLVTKVPPPETANYETPGVRKLIALCAELQRRAGNEPFYLDCRSAGRCVGADHNTANNWLNMLATDGLLFKVEQGRPQHASRWRWKGSHTEAGK